MGLYDATKDALTLIQKADNLELYSKILDIQKQALDLQEENKVLREENQKLKDNSHIKDKLVIKENMYYLKDSDIEKGPYCTRCWDVDKELVLMHSDNATNSEYICPHDKGKVRTSMSYKEQSDFEEKIWDMNTYTGTQF